MPTYTELVDVYGPVRHAAMAAFRELPGMGDLSDSAVHNATWAVWRQIVADLLDATDCPQCDGATTLGEHPDSVLCPTCDGDGYVYGRVIVDTTKPVADASLPAKTSGVRPDWRPRRPDPLDVDPLRITRP